MGSLLKGFFIMIQHSAGLDNRSSGQRNRRFDALPAFIFRNGYTLETKDLGNSGVKIELSHEYDAIGAIILPPKEVGDFGRWLLQTLGQDRYGLPSELPEILDRLSKQKKASQILQRGDKTKIRDALKVLKS
jgi:hypothetical protein